MATPAAGISNLVEVADPPLPNRTTPITSRSAGEKVKIFVVTLLVGVALCALSWWLLNNGIKFYGVVSGLIGALVIIAAFSGSTEKAGCPFCGSSVSVLDREEGRRIRCEKCSEYSVVNAGLLRPLDPATISGTPEFESPAFRNGVWPKGCVGCGAPAQRLDDLSATTVGGVGLLVGVLQVMRGSVKGVPYCAQHRDKLALKVTRDKKLYLRWTSLRMMRRYLAANRGR